MEKPAAQLVREASSGKPGARLDACAAFVATTGSEKQEMCWHHAKAVATQGSGKKRGVAIAPTGAKT